MNRTYVIAGAVVLAVLGLAITGSHILAQAGDDPLGPPAPDVIAPPPPPIDPVAEEPAEEKKEADEEPTTESPSDMIVPELPARIESAPSTCGRAKFLAKNRCRARKCRPQRSRPRMGCRTKLRCRLGRCRR